MPQSDDELVMEFSIKPIFPERSRFSVLFHIYDRFNDDQIVVGQWNTTLVILNSDDYSNKRREPKIYIPLEQDRTIRYIIIKSDNSGTSVYIDGELKGENQNLKMFLPDHPEMTNLVIGNAIGLQNPWSGSLYGLAIYDKILADDIIQNHYDYWTENKRLTAEETIHLKLLYTLEQEQGTLIQDRSGNGNNLILPQKITVLKREFLRIPDLKSLDTPYMIIDLLLNYFGFIPLGVFLSLTMASTGILKRNPLLIGTVLISFLFSISIETAQVAMASRDSSLIDLILNTLGGLSGGLMVGRKSNQYL